MHGSQRPLIYPNEAIVNSATETREVISILCDGLSLRGTYHKPPDFKSGLQAVSNENRRTGLLFLNAGFLPRSASGDSAAYWADWFATCGYPCFRMDLPGLGDSDGDIPPDMIDFANDGGYAPIISAAVKELTGRFRLKEMVIVGHCLGAVSALYAAAISRECRGLILMDPYFHLPVARTKIHQGLSSWTKKHSAGKYIGSAFDFLKQCRLLVRGNNLPPNANRPLLRCYMQLLKARMPILILKAPGFKTVGSKPRPGEFDYLHYIQELSRHSGLVAVKFVEGTSHTFANRTGREAVRQHGEKWLNVRFPLDEVKEARAHGSPDALLSAY